MKKRLLHLFCRSLSLIIIMSVYSGNVWAMGQKPPAVPPPSNNPIPGNNQNQSVVLKFVAYGDSRTNAGTHDKLCGRINSEDPELVIHTGDIWDNYILSNIQNNVTNTHDNIVNIHDKIASQINAFSPFKRRAVSGRSQATDTQSSRSSVIDTGVDHIADLVSDVYVNATSPLDKRRSAIWERHLTSRSTLKKLLKDNKFLVARGNHETAWSVKSFSPSIVRNNNIRYSFLEGNVFFVCLGMDPSASYLESQLKKPEAQNADFRIIYHHYPIFSSGSHGARGNEQIEEICDKYNVTLSFAGHDHHYERSKVIYDQYDVYSGRDVPADVKGTTYVVTGGGGAPIYSAGSEWWTDNVASKNHYCSVVTYDDRLEMTVKDINGVVIEIFIREKFVGP